MPGLALISIWLLAWWALPQARAQPGTPEVQQVDFGVFWPPKAPAETPGTNPPPLLDGRLVVKVEETPDRGVAARLRVLLSRRPDAAGRAFWNQSLAFPEYDWMRYVRVWDAGHQWLWPNLAYLLRLHGEERVERYGGVDPGKGVDNDFAAVLIRKYDAAGQTESEATRKTPLVAAEWYPTDAAETKKETIVHAVQSDEFTLSLGRPGQGPQGSALVWLIYADFMGARLPASWPKELEYAGGILACFKVQWDLKAARGARVSVRQLVPPHSTGFDWEPWAVRTRTGPDSHATARLADAPLRAGRADYLVGVYYFAGWWRQSPNKWETGGRDWRADYPGRVPLLGEYNDQATMDREILAAATHGVDFFQILWYPNGGPLNEGWRTFSASTNADRLKFTLEYVNHPPFALTNEADWEAACRQWCAAMQHPSYLRLAGRPVFKIHGLDFFYRQNGEEPKQVAARLEVLRRIARANGLSEPLIGGGVMPGGVPPAERVAPFDFLTTYMDLPDLPPRPEPYPFARLVQHAETGWLRYAEQSSKPYVPYLPAGWDPRPWRDPRPSFAFPARPEWTAALARVKAALDQHPKLGIPVKGGRQKMLLIYAWNEFGEGGIVAPTRGEKEMKLEAVREVFGSR